MRVYQCSVHLFTVTQRKESLIKHRCLFLFHTRLILLASGLRVERRTAAVADFYTLISTHSCCSCTQMRSMKLLFGSQNSRSLHTANFQFLKGVKICFLKTIRQSQFEANVKVKLPSVVVRTSFKIFRALFDVRPSMRRLSQALQIECKTWRIGV